MGCSNNSVKVNEYTPKSNRDENKREGDSLNQKIINKEDEIRQRIPKEEEERKKKEEEERIKKEEENKIESKESEEEYQKLKQEELSNILPSDQDKPSKSCVFLGVYGNFYTDKEKALQRINEIRKEACNEGVKDPETNKKFKPSDYKPYKWSTEFQQN